MKFTEILNKYMINESWNFFDKKTNKDRFIVNIDNVKSKDLDRAMTYNEIINFVIDNNIVRPFSIQRVDRNDKPVESKKIYIAVDDGGRVINGISNLAADALRKNHNQAKLVYLGTTDADGDDAKQWIELFQNSNHKDSEDMITINDFVDSSDRLSGYLSLKTLAMLVVLNQHGKLTGELNRVYNTLKSSNLYIHNIKNISEYKKAIKEPDYVKTSVLTYSDFEKFYERRVGIEKVIDAFLADADK